jgi:serine/arginine repetitive matrix protein 2
MYEPTTAKPAPEQIKGSGRFSLRSLSPTGSTFRRGSMTSASPGRMRHSLRADSNEASSSRVRIPTFSKATGKKAKSRLSSSRFGDSSDEEDGRNAFSSRFADSSDEDDFRSVQSKSQGRSKTMRNNMSSASAAAAAMGAPARQRQETESPDLPDSDDEDVPPPRQQVANGTTNGKANGSLHRSGSGRGNIGGSHHSAAAILDAAPARPAQKRRGSFMSAILGRKKGQTGKIAKGTGESAARRDTPLERSTDELSMIRTGSNNSRPRLQKRQPSWPFPDEPGVGTASSKDRPSTATGPTQTKPQTDYAARRSSSYNGPVSASALADDVAAPPSEANTGTPKKKKFGTLRKMFRLGD